MDREGKADSPSAPGRPPPAGVAPRGPPPRAPDDAAAAGRPDGEPTGPDASAGRAQARRLRAESQSLRARAAETRRATRGVWADHAAAWLRRYGQAGPG